MLFIGILVRIRNVHRSDTLLWPPHHLMLNQIKALMHSDSSIMAMKVDIYHTVDLYDNIKHSYLKECHVGAIIAIVLVIVCVVDKRTVFFWNTITCRDTSFKHVLHERHNLSWLHHGLTIIEGKMNLQGCQKCIQDIVRTSVHHMKCYGNWVMKQQKWHHKLT